MSADLSPAGAGPDRPIRVFLAEDHHITLWGLRRLIDGRQPYMTVVGTATTREELLAHPALEQTDVVLLDLDLQGEDSADSLAALQRRCSGHVLVFTGSDDAERHRAAVLQGARGVVHKIEPAETILRAIEKVSAGEIWLKAGLLGDVMGRLTGRNSMPAKLDADEVLIASLTPREREIVEVMTGMPTAKQLVVAAALRMSEHTLRNHLTTIYSKLGVRGRLELHLYALRHGLGKGERR